MNPWVFGLVAALLGNILYHLMSKQAASGGKPFTMLTIVYGVALVITLVLALFAEAARPADAMRMIASPAVLLLALAVVLIEAGYLWAYAQGAPFSTSSTIVNAGLALALAALGVLMFREALNARAVAGIVLALGGVWLIGTARAAG